MKDSKSVPTTIIVYVVSAALAAHNDGHFPTPPYPPSVHVEQTKDVSATAGVSIAPIYASTKTLALGVRSPQ